MGTGKTTVGKELTKKIGIPWLDLDHLFEQQQEMTIDEYFNIYGEDCFRREEAELLHETLRRPSHIITTGGGIVLRQENRQSMKKNGWVYHLKASPNEIIRRVQKGSHRPLLKDNLEARVKQLLKEREEMYDFADFSVDTTDRTIREVVQEIYTSWQTNTV